MLKGCTQILAKCWTVGVQIVKPQIIHTLYVMISDWSLISDWPLDYALPSSSSNPSYELGEILMRSMTHFNDMESTEMF